MARRRDPKRRTQPLAPPSIECGHYHLEVELIFWSQAGALVEELNLGSERLAAGPEPR